MRGGVAHASQALSVAQREGVQIKLYSIIYELIDQVKEAMSGLLDPLTREKVLGHAKVKQVFKVNRGYVGGSLVTDGRIDRNLISVGNLIQADQSVLTTIVTLNPIDFYFDVDERRLLNFARTARRRSAAR